MLSNLTEFEEVDQIGEQMHLLAFPEGIWLLPTHCLVQCVQDKSNEMIFGSEGALKTET